MRLPIPVPSHVLNDALDIVARTQRVVDGKTVQDPERVVAFAVPGTVFTVVPQRLLSVLGKTSLDSPLVVLSGDAEVSTGWKLRDGHGQEYLVDHVTYFPNKTDPSLILCETKENLS